MWNCYRQSISQIYSKIIQHKLHFWDPNRIVLIVIPDSTNIQWLSTGFSLTNNILLLAEFTLNSFSILFMCLLLSFCFLPNINRWRALHTKWRRSFGEWAASGLWTSAELQPGIPASPSRTGVRLSTRGTLLVRGAPNHRDHGWDR